MHWSAYSTIILVIVLIITSYLPLSVIYYHRIIKPNDTLPLFRIRRPKFIILFLIVILSNAVLRATLSFLTSVQMMHPTLYDILLQISTFYGSLPLACIRMWLLYYDTKSARKQRKYMLSKYLTSVEDIIQKENRKTHSNIVQKKYRNIWGKYKPLLFIIYSIVTVFFALDMFLSFALSVTSRPMSLLFLVGCIIFWTVLLCSMWGYNRCCCCKNTSKQDSKEQNISLESSFRDDWNLLLEMTLIWSVGVLAALIGVPLARVLSAQAKPVLNSCIACVVQTANVLITFYCPYSILLKPETPKTDSTKRKQKSLIKILSKKSYFFAFVEHLQHELSIENLTFLVELWQFKYEEKYDLTSMDRKDMKKAALVKEHLSKWSRERRADIESSGGSHTTKSFSLLPNANGTSPRASILMQRKFLEALPWCDLPLTQTLAVNAKDKWVQCMEIFCRFIGNDSYYAINIGYEATEEMYYHYDRLVVYKEQKGKTVDSVDVEEGRIASDEEFNAVMMGIFDYAVGDVLENLHNAYNRFITTDTYKMLNG